jgi:hypothetical protein
MSKKINVRSLAAKKANQTRRNRAAFQDKYSSTYDIAREVLRGKTNEQIYDSCCAWNSLTAAVRANLNRPGMFRTMALACRY